MDSLQEQNQESQSSSNGAEKFDVETEGDKWSMFIENIELDLAREKDNVPPIKCQARR